MFPSLLTLRKRPKELNHPNLKRPHRKRKKYLAHLRQQTQALKNLTSQLTELLQVLSQKMWPEIAMLISLRFKGQDLEVES